MNSQAQTEQLILVDDQDQRYGVADKLTVHKQGLCHRAFSVFVCSYDGTPKVLLQQRQLSKYHCGGLWSNTCCGHPRPEETVMQAAKRRLQEEMGLSMTMVWCGKFHYIAPFANGLTENEIDHVLIAPYQGEVIDPSNQEVNDYCWIDVETLQNQLANDASGEYTPWLSQALHLACKTIG